MNHLLCLECMKLNAKQGQCPTKQQCGLPQIRVLRHSLGFALALCKWVSHNPFKAMHCRFVFISLGEGKQALKGNGLKTTNSQSIAKHQLFSHMR